MSWRIVSVSSLAKLDYKMDYLVVRTQESIRRVHLSEISVLLIESTAVSLTAYLLCELAKWKIDVVFCDEKRFPYGMLLPLHGSYDTSLRYKAQAGWDAETKGRIWAEIIRCKIRGQIAVLPKDREAERRLLFSYLHQVQPGDATNREGHAAKVYFNALFGMSFTRTQECAVNAALNYGYSVLLSAVAREIAACGYCSQIGVFHDNRFNAFNLACDLMEPFRPLIDRTVRDLEFADFGKEQKREVIQTLNEQVLIGEKNQYVVTAIRIFVRSTLDAMDQKDPERLTFPVFDYEL